MLGLLDYSPPVAKHEATQWESAPTKRYTQPMKCYHLHLSLRCQLLALSEIQAKALHIQVEVLDVVMVG